MRYIFVPDMGAGFYIRQSKLSNTLSKIFIKKRLDLEPAQRAILFPLGREFV